MCCNFLLVKWLLDQCGILKDFPQSRCIFVSHWSRKKKQSFIIVQIEGAIWFGLNDLFSSPFPDNSWCPCSQRILDQGLAILHTYCFIRYRTFLRMIVFIAEGIYSNCLITDCKKMSQALLSTTVPSTCMQLLNICSITSFIVLFIRHNQYHSMVIPSS